MAVTREWGDTVVTEKDRLILDVINDVREELSGNQLEKLKLSLFQRLLPLDVKTAEANIVPYEQTNEQFIELWLAAKRMDCCSEGTIQAYKYTCLLYTSPSPRDRQKSRMPSSA